MEAGTTRWKDKQIAYVTVSITKTCLCNVDPLKPHIYIVKLGITEVYIIVLFC